MVLTTDCQRSSLVKSCDGMLCSEHGSYHCATVRIDHGGGTSVGDNMLRKDHGRCSTQISYCVLRGRHIEWSRGPSSPWSTPSGDENKKLDPPRRTPSITLSLSPFYARTNTMTMNYHQCNDNRTKRQNECCCLWLSDEGRTGIANPKEANATKPRSCVGRA